MIDLEIQFDKDKYKDMIARAVLFNKDIDKAVNRAARRAGDAGKAETKRQLAAEYTLPSSEIGKTIEVKPLSEGVKMRIFSSVHELILFNTKPKTPMPPAKGPVRVQVKKGDGSSELGHAFVAKMPNGHIGIFEREGQKRKNKDTHGREIAGSKVHDHIQELFGPSTVGMFEANETVHNAVIEKIMETLDKRMIHELDFILNDKSSRANLK
ncbi:hypothetical protein FACS189468_7360 [Spirochaetia bacterium]|nr:hypothetical protein FACS189468_7360 [Spirochaetia bacterium]